MIDPINMTQYDLSHEKLEETLLFAVCAAGKNAVTTAKCLETFLNKCRYVLNDNNSPFKLIELADQVLNLEQTIRSSGLGCYNNRAKSFRALYSRGLNLKECSIEELESIPGIGPKTSRFFLLHTRRDVKLAALDVHILRYMGDHGIVVPKSTPTGVKYLHLEQKFLELAQKSGKSVAEFDLDIWREYRKKV